MDKRKKISVVVPIYNTEKYLDRCINSILNQTYSNFELLLINDGSTDNSLRIAKSYEKDKRVKVFSHKNHGAGYTKNKGIDIASGEFILFVDSDDAIEEDTLSLLIENIRDNDVIVFGFKRKDSDTDELSLEFKPIASLWTRFKYVSTWGKMYRLSLIKDNKIYYPKLKLLEDMYFNLKVLSTTDKYTVLEESKYINYINPNSVTAQVKKSGKAYDCIDALKIINNDINLSMYDSKMINFLYLKTIVHNVISQIKKLSAKELTELYKKNYKWLKEEKNEGKKIKSYIQKGESTKINIIINLFLISSKLKIEILLVKMLKIVYRG